MDPSIDTEWLGIKHDQVEETPVVGNVARSWQWRERGINPPQYPPNKLVLENVAEDILVQKPLKIRSCDLPGYPRSTFLMVFSPDGTKVASTHGNHNVYVSELASGKHVRILKGHPRTPWCIAFHPSHTQLIGSGCLGGQVRVWDIASGGSEVWNVRNETVIASIAFHPREQLLVIATYNELYFWDWSQPAPFTKVSTNNVNEKVRYVAFDALGYKLITGISLRGTVGSVVANNALLAQSVFGNTSNSRRDDGDSPNGNQSGDNSGSAQDMIVNSYQNLVQRYDSLVRNYQRLFMVRNRLNNPPVPTTMDRGTDPMETDVSSTETSTWSRLGANRPPRQNIMDVDTIAGPSNRINGGESETGTRILNLDVLSLENDTSRNQDSTSTERTSFGSRSSAFQPLSEFGRPSGSGEQNGGPTRLLPNPFSSSNSTPRASRISLTGTTQHPGNDNANTSRTSVFTSTRSGSISRRVFVFRRRNFSPTRRDLDSSRGDSSTSTESATQPSPPRRSTHHYLPEAEFRNLNERRRPTMANSSTQMSPTTVPLDAQTLNESLDLIRDILRDSGTRLLNLITDMSLSMPAGNEGRPSRRGDGSRAHSDDGARSQRAGSDARAPRTLPRLLSASWRREFLFSSDSDSDNTLEVNILRTRNSTFREENSTSADRPSTSAQANARAFSTDRMVFELAGNSQPEGSSHDSNGVNVSLSNDRFRVRTQSGSGGEQAATAAAATDEAGPSQRRAPSAPDFSRPSTSRDTFWTRGSGSLPPDEAFRKVRSGISALHKHTLQLVNLSQRRSRTTTRELRVMWENLRRRILTLHRETGRPDVPGYYTRSLLERCMMLAEISDPAPRTANRSTRPLQRDEDGSRAGERNRDPPSTSGNSAADSNERPDDLPTNNLRHSRERRPDTSRSRSSPDVPTTPSARRRVQSSSRWRHDDELRRRSRNPVTNRLAQRYSNRSRRDFTRAIEINATRHEIRMRAMQVLSVMFNMMMMCLEERGLSQLIIIMLRTLKKALALTCYMLMSNRSNTRSGLSTAQTSQPLDSMDVVRIQNVDDAGPVNVDGTDETSLSSNTRKEETKQDKKQKENKRADGEKRCFSQRGANGNACEVLDLSASSSSFPTQRWSNRLAVQIAAANRNNSATARNRRELYLESKRLKALHRTNPSAHPLIKKRVMPPMSTYRIPHLRNVPNRPNPIRFRVARRELQNNEPVAGPSNASPAVDNSNQDVLRNDGMNEIDERVNFIRIASQAIRNAPRNRFRRLQTIRLYTPSSVREMFALQPNSTDNLQENRSPLQNNPESGTRRPFTLYRPHILTPRSDSASRAEASNHIPGLLNNLTGGAVPADMPVTMEMPGITVQRIPRIHEYLQPIILAQNAMLIEDENAGNINPAGGSGGGGDGGSGGGSGNGGGSGPSGAGAGASAGQGAGASTGAGAGAGGSAGGLGNSLSSLMGGGRRLSGMAGLLDAGIISEALPAPSHRVQAWDFTTGDAPDIADTTKNVVVQRCRIHNDASIDISRDGRLLVALLPVPRLRNTNHWLGVYSLEWARLGQCLHTAVMEQAAVSVALSPTARHLAVGLGSRRFTSAPHSRNNVFALLYRLDPLESSSRTGLSPVKELEQNWEHGFTSLNCLRWAPQPGQGLVYANNTGQLIIMS